MQVRRSSKRQVLVHFKYSQIKSEDRDNLDKEGVRNNTLRNPRQHTREKSEDMEEKEGGKDNFCHVTFTQIPTIPRSSPMSNAAFSPMMIAVE